MMRSGPLHAILHAATSACDDGSMLLLAVSGGLDSTVLLHAVNTVAHGRIAGIATFDHGSGAAATAAVEHVHSLAERYGLPCFTGTMPSTLSAADGLEAAWRNARHAFLRDTARRVNGTIVTGHTEDDHIETVLMRIMRGSGARGLAALYAPGAVLRPFVRLRRAALFAYAADVNLEWSEDPTNESRRFFRNRVRHDLLPALRSAEPGIDDALLALSRRAAGLRYDLERLVDGMLLLGDAGQDYVRLPMAALSGFDQDSLALIWGALAARAGSVADRRGIARAAEFLASGRRAGFVPLSSGWCLSGAARRLHSRACARPRTGGSIGGECNFGVRVYAAVTRQPSGPVDRYDTTFVSESTADPRLEGRALRRIVYDKNDIDRRVQELGAEITAAYPDGDLLVLGLLKGSFIFLSDLVRQINRPLHVDFLVAASYGEGTVSSGNVRLVYDPETKLEGKHILLVEDIVDTGRTLNRLMDILRARNPRSLDICALLHKHIAAELRYETKFVGYDCPHEFLVGYGLDHAESFRHLPYIASLL